MNVIFFLKDDFRWTEETSEKVFNYFYDIIGTEEATILIENENCVQEIFNIVQSYKAINDKITIKLISESKLAVYDKVFVDDIYYLEGFSIGEEDYYNFLVYESDLLIIDINRQEEIVFKYVPYTYKGKFRYIKK